MDLNVCVIFCPTGFTMLLSLPVFEETGRWSVSLPNWYNWSFHFPTFLKIYMMLFLPGRTFKMLSINWNLKFLQRIFHCTHQECKNGWPRIASFSMVLIPSNYPLNACVYISMHDLIHYNQSLPSTIFRSSPKSMCN